MKIRVNKLKFLCQLNFPIDNRALLFRKGFINVKGRTCFSFPQLIWSFKYHLVSSRY